MKRFLLFVFIGFFCFSASLSGFAAGTFHGASSTDPYYQQATPTSTKPQASHAATAAQMAKVQAIMQRAKALQQAKSTHSGMATNAVAPNQAANQLVNQQPAAQQAMQKKATAAHSLFSNQQVPVQQFESNANTPTKAKMWVKPFVPASQAQQGNASKVAAGSGNNQVAKIIESQLLRLNQAHLLFQQKTNQQIENLTNANNALNARMQKLVQVIRLLNQEMNQLNSQAKGQPAAMPTSSQNMSSTNNKEGGFFLFTHRGVAIGIEIGVFILIILSMIMIVLLIMRRRTQPQLASAATADVMNNEAVVAEEDDTQAEYDFMGSEEAIPAKLDLARTYLAMEDYEQAKTVLQQVTQIGNPEQCEAAEKILKEIPSDS